jgi:predicted PhzF superfamily epimerase YddE/YHI9
MKRSKIIFQVDAFTNQPFRGNPAGVCILERKPDSKWMQNMAMEMNLSETAFVFPVKGKRNIRFFSPEAEIPLCGHATLSASHILYETGIVKEGSRIDLNSMAGVLTVSKNGSWIIMNFPAFGIEKIPLSPIFNRLTGASPQELYKTGHGWTLALLGSEEEIRKLTPDFAAMKQSEFGDVIFTALSADLKYDFCLRCFAPALGINEDPVTGSAHCALVPFWSSRTGKTDFVSRQVSKREGILKTTLRGDRVEISGQARTIFKAELYV